MSAISTTSLSGMTAAQTALQASAHNVANLATPGFRREQVLQTSTSDGGVTATLAQASRQGNALEKDVVDQLVAKYQFLANLAVFKTNDQMMGALLDTTG